MVAIFFSFHLVMNGHEKKRKKKKGEPMSPQNKHQVVNPFMDV